MKKLIKYISLIFILISCNNFENTSKDLRIEQFENFLGKEQSEVLTELVKSFDKFTSINFINCTTNEAYKKFLEIFESGKYHEKEWKFEGINKEEIINKIELSGLREEIWLYPDSSWIKDNLIYSEYIYINENDTCKISSTGSLVKDEINSDSTFIERYKRANFNLYGKYYNGLDTIKASDSLIVEYLNQKYIAGITSPHISASGIMYYGNSSLDDYFCKRIIAVELYLRVILLNNFMINKME